MISAAIEQDIASMSGEEKKEFLELHLEDTLKLLGLEPEALSISLREQPDPLPAWEVKKYEPSLEELLNTLPMKHIEDVKKCFEACKSRSDIAKVIKAAPAYLGTFWAEYDEHSYIIVNRFFDDDIGERLVKIRKKVNDLIE